MFWSGGVQVPRGVAALVDQARWNTWFVMSLFVALLIPVIVFRLSKQLTSRAMPAFAARIWCAELLQVAGWLCGSAADEKVELTARSLASSATRASRLTA